MLAQFSHERSQALLRQRNMFALTSAGLALAVVVTGGLAATRDREVVRFGVRRGPANERGYWPFSVQVGREPARFYTSDGTTFAEVTAPEAAAP